jgi:hypothetical protein
VERGRRTDGKVTGTHVVINMTLNFACSLLLLTPMLVPKLFLIGP